MSENSSDWRHVELPVIFRENDIRSSQINLRWRRLFQFANIEEFVKAPCDDFLRIFIEYQATTFPATTLKSVKQRNNGTIDLLIFQRSFVRSSGAKSGHGNVFELQYR
jgi:hypothetical protein